MRSPFQRVTEHTVSGTCILPSRWQNSRGDHGTASTLRNMTGKVTALQNYYYWSSSEVIDAGSGAWVFYFNNPSFARNSLTYPGNIRAVFAY